MEDLVAVLHHPTRTERHAGVRGERFRHWQVRLFPGNDPDWVTPHLGALAEAIRTAREEAGYTAAPDEITVAV